MPDGWEVDKSEILADSGMVQLETYVEVLFEQFFIEGIPALFLVKGFVDKESSVLDSKVQLIESTLGRVDEFETLGVCMYAARGIRQEKTGRP